MHQLTTLKRIWERTGDGFVYLPVRNAITNEWVEGDAVPISLVLDEDFESIEPFDQYYTPIPQPTDQPRKAVNLDQWGVLYADLDSDFDEAILDAMPPTILIETSAGSYQAIWFLSEPVSVADGADLNRRLSYLIQADRGSWIPTKVLRVPYSVNYKRGGVPVEVRGLDWTIEYPPDRLFEDLPDAPQRTISEEGTVPAVPSESEWRALLHKHWPSFDHRTRVMLGEAQVSDRSLRLIQLANLMIRKGISHEETFKLLALLPINKFAGRPDVLWKSVVLTAGN